MVVTVIVPTFNRRKSLLRCLRSLPEDLEIVVVDDGSTDGTEVAIAHVRHPHLTYIRRQNGGPASARNEGVAAASGKFVAFIDDDCVAVDGWPWPLVARLRQGGRGLAGVGGRVHPLRDDLMSRYYTVHRILEPPESCLYLVTANCAYKREALVQAQGFDTDIGTPGGEDVGLSVRVRDLGYELCYEPSAVVLHDYRKGFVDFVRTFYRYGRGCGHVLGQ